VWINRKGDFVFPIDIEVTFDNGERIRERWDAQDRWVRYVYEKKAKVASVVIDPDHKINLDRDNFNNSKLVKGNGSPAHKLVNYWTFLTQFVAQCLAGWMV